MACLFKFFHIDCRRLRAAENDNFFSMRTLVKI